MRLRLQFITPIGSDHYTVFLSSQSHALNIDLLCEDQEINLTIHPIGFMLPVMLFSATQVHDLLFFFFFFLGGCFFFHENSTTMTEGR